MRTRKRFGQHFLVPDWADKLVAAIDPQPQDRFLEIGPGPGALTLRLAPRVEHLVTVEVDRDLTAALAPQLPANVDLVEGDFLTLDLDAILAHSPLRVAGNLPYNVATPILFRLIDTWRTRTLSSRPMQGAAGGHNSTRPWRDATLMIQREVAERIEAQPGSRDYGVLSIATRLHADVQRVLTLPPGAFRPPPKVHSAVIRLTFRTPAVALRDEQLFERMVRSMFTQRRKTLANALASFAASRQAESRAALTSAGIDATRRAETLDLAELARLADYFAGR
jgi:16S rRNA (adenine1518-N6/adenine1519-N6)-dimethyltransferase